MVVVDFAALAALIGIPILRSVGGWLTNSLEDGILSTFEWKQLGSTIIRVGLVGFATFFGLNGVGIDVSALGAAFGALIMDKLFNALKKTVPVDK